MQVKGNFLRCVLKLSYMSVKEFVSLDSSIQNAFSTAIVFDTLTENRKPGVVKYLNRIQVFLFKTIFIQPHRYDVIQSQFLSGVQLV